MFDIFLIVAQNIDCGYTLESHRRGGCNEYPKSMLWITNIILMIEERSAILTTCFLTRFTLCG